MNKLNKIIYIVILIISFQNALFVQLSSNNTNENEKVSLNRKLNEKKIRKRKIRIFIDDTYIKSQNNGRYTVVINSLKQSVNYWSKLLKVERLTYKITSDMMTDCEIPTYNTELINGYNTDLVIFPYFGSLEGNYFAASRYCSIDYNTGRPIGGTILINQNIDSTRRNADLFLTQLFMHELGHIFIFDTTLYKKEYLIKRTILGRERLLISSPKVVAAGRRHYNCPSLEGIELEDNGGELSVHSHWESRIMDGDIMVSLVDRVDFTISEITLALFEDSGWYETKNYTGGLFRAGKGRGCSFLTLDCKTQNSVFFNDFIYNAATKSRSCSPSRTGWGKYIIENNYADGCRVVSKSNIEDNTDGIYYSKNYFPSNCFKGVNYIFSHGENYSPNSICVLSKASASGTGDSGKPYKAVCVKATCTKNSLYLTLDENNSILCPRAGGLIRPGYTEGPILCPDYNLICTGEVFCNSLFDCINKKSRPKSNTFTYDYSIATTLNVGSPGSVLSPPMEENDDGLCSPQCSGCFGKKMCNLCPNNYKLFIEPYYFCWNAPSNTYIYLGDKEYATCDSDYTGCYKCTKTKCTSCKSGFYLEDDDCYFNKNSNPYCQRWNYDGCTQCTTAAFFIENDKICKLKNNYNLAEFYTLDNIKYIHCYKAMPNCKECSSVNKCTKCNSGYILVDNNKCMTSNLLNNDQYLSLNGGLTYNSCSNLMPNCKRCDNNTYCKECNGETVFVLDPLNPRCVDDIDVEDINGIYYDPENDIFRLCNENNNHCSECGGKDICSKCEDGYNLITLCNKNSNICIDKNEINNYQYDTTNKCYNKCLVTNCEECPGNINQCQKCNNDYAILNDNKSNCISKNNLGNNTFTNDSGIHYYDCNKSISNCNICSNNGTICQLCNSNYYFLNDDKTKCHKETDLKAQYENKIYKHDEYNYYSCNKSVNNCEKCNNSTYCNSCESNYGLICNENNICHPIENFQNHYFKNNILNCYNKCIDYGCNECTSEINCKSCIENYTLYGKRCFSDESIGEQTCINSNGITKNCSEEMENCIYCKGCNICTQCIGSNVVIYENDYSFPCRNIESLKNEYYLNKTRNIYYPCYYALNNCKQCSNENICLSCLNGYVLLFDENYIGKCVIEDDIDKKKYLPFPDSDEKKYYPCSFYFPECDSCININKCEKCKNEYGFINWDKSKCVKIKDNNEICEIDNGKNYVSCSGNILYCKSSTNNICNECIEDFTIFNNNNKECSEIKYEYNNSKKYYTPDNGIHYYSCDILINNCDECSSNKICNECKAGYVVVDDEKCEDINTLNTTLYITDDGNHYYTCSKQINNCLTCQGKNICSKCQENYTILNRNYDKCIESKDFENNDKYYSMDNGTSYYSCYNLMKNCNRCSNEKTCIECFDNYFTINDELSKCININDIDNENCEKENNKHYNCYFNQIENCKSYYNIKKENCSECEDGYSIISNDYTKCKLENDYKNNKSYYTNNGGKNYYKCNEKIDNCKECLKNGNQCTKCENNYYFINGNNNECINENTLEEYSYYKINDLEYYKCDYKGVNNCEKCYSGNHCIQCKENYTILDEDYTQCYLIENLNKQYYKDDEYHYKSCHKVLTNCEECLNSTYCTKCPKYYILKDDHLECNWNESIGGMYYIDKNGNTKKCSEAMENCNFCISENFCTLCNSGILVEELDKSRYCINNNNKKEYYSVYSDLGLIYYPCKKGVTHCKICESKDHCILCEKPFSRIYNNYSYCFSEEEINEYGNEYIKVNDTEYYPCNYYIKNCKQCKNKDTCILCEENYSFLNDDNSKCYSQNDLSNYCSDDNKINYYNCEGGVIHCDYARKENKCDKCSNDYTILNSDTSKCININKLTPIDHYYTIDNGIHYISCDNEFDYCYKCNENNGQIKCNSCYNSYGLIMDNRRNKCYDINKTYNHYYLTQDEDNNYQFKQCLTNCKICTNNEICNECNEQYHSIRNSTKCIPNLDCKLIIYTEDSTLDEFPFEKYIRELKENKENTVIIVFGKNNDYNISIYNDYGCGEILLKNDFIALDFIEQSNNNRRRLDELDLFYKVVIKNILNKKTSFKIFNNEIEELKIEDLYSNYAFEKNLTSSFINDSKTIKLIKNLDKTKINILNENDKIFNDICESLSINNYDIPLKDRKLLLLLNEEEICGNNCNLSNIFYEDLVYKCNCKIKGEIEFYEDEKIINKKFKKISTSKKINDYFKYLGCKISSNKLKTNGGFYFTLMLLIIQIFLSIFYFILFKKDKISSNLNNPPIKIKEKPEIEENDDSSKEKYIDKTRNKFENSNENLNIGEINIMEKKFFEFYKKNIIQLFIPYPIKLSNKIYHQEFVNWLLNLIFNLSLSLYICSLSIHQNYISGKYFTNDNRISFIFKSQFLPILIFTLISFILYYIIYYVLYSIEKIKTIFYYSLIVSIILMIFFFISITQFGSIYPQTILDLFIRFFTFIILFNILKLIIVSIILFLYFNNYISKNGIMNKVFDFIFIQ